MRKNVIMTKVIMLLKVIMTKRVIFRLSKPKNLLTKTKKKFNKFVRANMCGSLGKPSVTFSHFHHLNVLKLCTECVSDLPCFDDGSDYKLN